MDGPTEWIGARIDWRVSDAAEPDVVFEARIDTAENVGDGITRLSGELVSGGRFVLVTDERSLARP
jgi:hypothetical protein